MIIISKAFKKAIVIWLFSMIVVQINSVYGAERIYYSIHLASFKNLENANKQVNSLKEKGKLVFWKETEIPNEGKFYRVYLPGEEGTPLPFTAVSYYWRNHHVFRYLPGEVTRVSFRYTNKKNKSFTVDQTNRGYFFEVNPPDSSLPARPDTGRIERYLTYFQSLDFDEFAFRLTREEKEKILKSPPRYEFRIQAGTSDSVLIVTYPMIRDTIDVRGTNPREDPDLTWAWVEPPGELVILKYYRIDPWIKEPAYFFPGN